MATESDNLSVSVPAVIPQKVPAGGIVSTESPNPFMPSDKPEDFTVVARYPYQLEKAQKELIAWSVAKVASLDSEISDLNHNLEIAIKNKMRMSPIQAYLRRATKRREFYEKLKAALSAGYYIVPNFPCEMFAVRTKRKRPKGTLTGRRYWNQAAEIVEDPVPVGEGRFVAPTCTVENSVEEREDRSGNIVEQEIFYPDEYRDEIDFPFSLAKPEVMAATERALTDKFFDELGVVSNRGQLVGDPIVVGRIIYRGPGPRRIATFLVAWFLNTQDL